MEGPNPNVQEDNISLSHTKPLEKGKKKYQRTLYVLLVLFLMLVSFLVGWRLMANRWWPVLSPYVKEAVYSVVPSLRPAAIVTPVEEEYHPRCDARVGDSISSTDSLFYYFYFPTCPYCSTYGNMLLSGLPEYITLPDGTRSRVVMIPLNKHDDVDLAYIDAFYTAHNIIKNDDQNDQIVPAIVIGDTYLRGTYAIRDFFYRMLLDGEGLNTPLIDGAERLGE